MALARMDKLVKKLMSNPAYWVFFPGKALNVIPSPGFKLVVLIGFRDDSWVFLNVFLNGHNIKRVHLCSKLKIMKKIKMPGKCKFLNK
jgi:hypothetical protein